MSDLTARLLAEIERREGRAREATPGPWHWKPPSEKQYPEADESLIGANDEPVLVGWGYDASGIDARDEDRAFIASNGPECVLAYLAALREIARVHHPDSADPHVCFPCGYSDGRWPCETIAAVAEGLGVGM